MYNLKFEWINVESVQSRAYICGFCGRSLASDKAYSARKPGFTNVLNLIYICHFCKRPTFIDIEDGRQWPGATYGNDVNEITDELVEKLYLEARSCTSTASYTASVMCSRKLLMHIAVAKGAQENKSFAYYVDYLADNNFVPPTAKEWVSHIKDKGNEANHEIKLMNKEDAEELISFSEMLLKLIFEFPARIKPQTS